MDLIIINKTDYVDILLFYGINEKNYKIYISLISIYFLYYNNVIESI